MTEIKLLQTELKVYEEHKAELVQKSNGKYVLIKGTEIIRIFETQQDAIKVGIEKYGNTPFLVKKIELIEPTQNFTSNLIQCCLKCHPLP